MPSKDALEIDHTGLLSDATLSALQLRQQPFRPHGASALIDPENSSKGDAVGDSDNAALYSDDTTAEQLADIKQALITGDDLLLILGDEGAGKSTLLSQLDTNSGLRIQCFPVQGSERFSTLNLYSGMLEAFKRNPPNTLKNILDELIPCLQQMAGKNTLSAIVLDDAHKVNQTELTQLLSGMLYINSQDETLLRVALAATVDFEDNIPDLLPEGADLPYSSLTIDGFTPQRAAAYLGFKLQNAGFDGEFPFSDRDMASLVEHSAGLPGELHALTADVFNEKYGRIEDSLPRELIADSGEGFIQSRIGKLILGVVATALIIGGLLMFMPEPGDDSSDQRYKTAGNGGNSSSEELKLIRNNTQNPDQNPDQNPNQNPDQTTDQTTSGISPITGSESETQASGLNNTATPPAVPPLPPAAETNAPTEQEQASTNSESTAEVATTALGSTAAEGGVVVENPEQQNAVETPLTDITANTAAGVQNTNGSNGSPPVTAEPTSDNQSTDVTAAELLDTSVSPEDAELAERLESPNWILLQDASRYTIQMSASRERASVENFLRQNPLSAPNSIFSFERDGVVWYALAHGIFNSIEEARQAVERMPQAALRDQPWIRSIRRVQSILRTP